MDLRTEGSSSTSSLPMFHADGEDFIIEPSVARPVLAFSQLMLITIVHAFLVNCYGAGIVLLVVYGTSINFWRRPTRGIRRNMDYAAVLLTFSYFAVLALRLRPLFTWIFFAALGVIAIIFIANEAKFWLNQDKSPWDYKVAVYVHCLGVHILANAICNVLLVGVGEEGGPQW